VPGAEILHDSKLKCKDLYHNMYSGDYSRWLQ